MDIFGLYIDTQDLPFMFLALGALVALGTFQYMIVMALGFERLRRPAWLIDLLAIVGFTAMIFAKNAYPFFMWGVPVAFIVGTLIAYWSWYRVPHQLGDRQPK